MGRDRDRAMPRRYPRCPFRGVSEFKDGSVYRQVWWGFCCSRREVVVYCRSGPSWPECKKGTLLRGQTHRRVPSCRN